MVATFADLLKTIADYPMRSVAIAAANDHTVLEAAIRASAANIAEPVFVGPVRDIRETANRHSLDISNYEIIDAVDEVQAAAVAVTMAAEDKVDMVMKGYIHTDDFLRAVLDKENGLRTGVTMSHVFVAELPRRDRFLLITDAAMNIAPNLEKKAEIVLNAVHLAHALDFEEPRVAALAAVEVLNPAMGATLDATCLSKMNDRGQFSPACIIDGPFALDNAVSEIAAKHKNITGNVAGKADILLVPDIEAGNILAKSLVYFAEAELAGVVIGTKCPVVLTSRSDSVESKHLSIALGVYLTNIERHLKLKIGKVHY